MTREADLLKAMKEIEQLNLGPDRGSVAFNAERAYEISRDAIKAYNAAPPVSAGPMETAQLLSSAVENLRGGATDPDARWRIASKLEALATTLYAGELEGYPFAWLLIRPDGTPHTILSGPPGPVVGPDHLTNSDRGIGWKSRPLYFAKDDDVCEVCGGRVLPGEEIPVPPIPAGVYYVGEADNFYNSADYKGMGHEFYRTWRDRRSEFPKTPMKPGEKKD